MVILMILVFRFVSSEKLDIKRIISSKYILLISDQPSLLIYETLSSSHVWISR